MNSAPRLGSNLPPFYLTNAGKPGFKAWADAMSAAAEHPNVYCKVSDLLSVDDSRTATDKRALNVEAVKPYTDHVIKAFGTGRCR